MARDSFYHSAQFPHRVIPEIGAFEFSRKTEPVMAISDKSFPVCADYPRQRSALGAFPVPDDADSTLDASERRLGPQLEQFEGQAPALSGIETR